MTRASDESPGQAAVEKIEVPPGFKVPEPKRFGVRGDKLLAVAGAAIAPLLRLGTGLFVKGYNVSLEPAASAAAQEPYAVVTAFGRRLMERSSPKPLPAKPIEIYEFEGCPFCRKVREIVTVLDLDVLFYPCPANGPQFRPKANAMGGKKQFPYMVDPNSGVAMYESDAIIKYLSNTYGDGTVPVMLSLGPITTITAGLALIGRMGKGSRYVPAKRPAKPLEVWAYESSPFCKLVREALSELELPHIYHSTGRGSPKREKFFREKGMFQVPYLEDPNTGVKMFESGDIVDYLYKAYALPA